MSRLRQSYINFTNNKTYNNALRHLSLLVREGMMDDADDFLERYYTIFILQRFSHIDFYTPDIDLDANFFNAIQSDMRSQIREHPPFSRPDFIEIYESILRDILEYVNFRTMPDPRQLQQDIYYAICNIGGNFKLFVNSSEVDFRFLSRYIMGLWIYRYLVGRCGYDFDDEFYDDAGSSYKFNTTLQIYRAGARLQGKRFSEFYLELVS